MTDSVRGREYRVERQLAMTQVFKKFQPVWTSAFQASKWPSLLEAWIDNCDGVETDVLEVAARDFIRGNDHKFPPKPWEFAKYARQLQRERFESVPLIESVVKRREWEWISPVTNRISRVALHGTDWVCTSLDNHEDFRLLSDSEKVTFCDRMETDYGQILKRPA